MLQHVYAGLDQDVFTIHITPEPIKSVTDIKAYNEQGALLWAMKKLNTESGEPWIGKGIDR